MFLEGARASLRAIARLAILCVALLHSAAAAADEAVGANDPDEIPSPSNYSGAGLLDMHTARFFPDGYLVLSTSFTQPDDRYAITFQALPWAELTFRYSITRAIFDTGVPVHDRSFDAKFRLSRETEYVPEIALGLQDFLGTGVYSAEYVAGSKRWGPFDVTLGLGWGRLGSRGTFGNPFRLFGESFSTRNTSTGSGGLPLLKSYFRGPDVGLFGGVEYQTPIEHLRLKIEYSSDAYARERTESGRDFGFPLNFGISYRPFEWLDVGLSLMHGDYAGIRISTVIDATKENWQARLDPPPRFRARPDERADTILQSGAPPPSPTGASLETHFVDLTAQREESGPNEAEGVPPAPPTPPAAPVEEPVAAPPVPQAAERENAAPSTPQVSQNGAGLDSGTSERISAGLDNQKLALLGTGIEGEKIVVLIENTRYRRDSEAIARTARVLSAAAPPAIEYFEITLLRAGQPLTTVTLSRTQIDKLALRDGSPAELFEASTISPGAFAPLDHLQPNLFPQLGGLVYPVFRQNLFDPDHPIYVRFGVGATEGLRLTRGWFIEGTVMASLYDNFNEIRRGTNSVLPHVRSDVAQYLKQGRFGIENLSTSYYFKLAPELFGRVSAGYLEPMFAGVGGELLYRPFGQRWAVGADLWAVRQRDYRVLFALRNYQAITGHLTAYYELPWHDVRVAVSVGEYLARDKGVTFEFSRRFSTGVQVGAWFTLTNVSSERFGEGSFDKGIRIIIPFEWVAPFATQSGYELSLRPIQRDGGQKLGGDTVLYGMTDPSSYGTLTQEWTSVFK